MQTYIVYVGKHTAHPSHIIQYDIINKRNLNITYGLDIPIRYSTNNIY